MSEIAVHQPALPATTALPPTETTVSLMEWAQELGAAHQIGTALCDTEFVPQSFRGKPEAAAAAILAGKALGLDPMNALSNIFIVKGRPAMYARTAVALAISKGHTIRRTFASDTRVSYEGRRRGDSGPMTTVEWTLDRAKKAGYTTNPKYGTNPQEMLGAKCQMELVRIIAPDALTGVAAYSAEEIELEDMGESGEPAEPKAKTTRQRKAPAQIEPPVMDVPDLEPDEPEQQDDAPEAEDGITPAQLTKLNIVLQEQGLTERDDKLQYLSTYLARPIASSKDLTKSEAHRLIDEHEQPAQP